MNKISKFIFILCVFISGEGMAKPLDVPNTPFEASLYLFSENIAIPLKYSLLSSPGVNTCELYICRNRGELEIIVLGERQGRWIGFYLHVVPDLETKNIMIDFHEIKEPALVKPSKVLEEWDNFGLLVNRITKDIPLVDDSPSTKLYVRKNGSASIKCDIKTHNLDAIEIDSEFKALMGRYGVVLSKKY